MIGFEELAGRVVSLERAVTRRGPDIALFLVYDRPGRSAERPGLARTFFEQRCVSDRQLDQTIDAFRSIGGYVELFDGERTAVFASDWPHHDFDHPQHVFGLPFSPEARRAILGENGARFYGIDIPDRYRRT